MTSYYSGAIDVHKSILAMVITDAAAEGEMVFVRRKFGALARICGVWQSRWRRRRSATW
jgi:hypothetical protein